MAENRKQQYINYARRIAKEYGIDPDIFVAQLNAESRFDPNARNPESGAIGIGQFIPSTAKGMGFTAGKDPLLDIRMAAKYMQGKLKMYKGDYRLALASYNAGSGNVAKYGGVPPFKETQNYVSKILKNAGKANSNAILTGGVETNGYPTGAAVSFDVPDPERPAYQPLVTPQNSIAIDNGKGLPQGRMTADEYMAANAITAPVEAPRDVRPDVIVGQDEQGNPIRVTASQYNDMLNQRDTQTALSLNQDLQQRLPEMAKAEVQLGGRNAYDTMLGLRDEYNQMLVNDPRWDLVRLTPEQARDVANRLESEYMWGGNHDNLTASQYYQMMNSLQNYQTPYSDAYDLTDKGYKGQLDNMKEFQKTALLLMQGNQELAQNLMQQAVAGNKNAIDMLQKNTEARIKAEADAQKEIQSGLNTQLNTQREGMNALYRDIPNNRLNQNQAVNRFNLDRYGTDVGKYGTDVGANVKMSMPQIQSNVDSRDPIKREQLAIQEGKLDVARQNANTAEGTLATNLILNSGMNPQGIDAATAGIPALRNATGNPNKNLRSEYFGFGKPVKNPVNLTTFTDLLNGD